MSYKRFVLMMVWAFQFMFSLPATTAEEATPLPTPNVVQEERQKKLQAALERIQREGASTKLGGRGFGAARVAPLPPEGLKYHAEVAKQLKQNWVWADRKVRLRARVLIIVEQDGKISSINLATSSGNTEFDESALAAVRKASPLVPAPQHLYQRFRNVSLWFDSQER